MMVAETAWLDSRILCHDGRVAWGTERGPMMPDGGAIALAQRRLYQIGRYPHAARLVIGDTEEWIAQRQERLELAKRLRTLHAPDLHALAERAEHAAPADARRLVDLLSVEAYCIDGLPSSPAAALALCGHDADPFLVILLEDKAAPAETRALGALALGAHRRRRAEYGPVPAALLQSAWGRQCYAWGSKWGVTAHPALVAALLLEEEGRSLARRCLLALSSPGPFTASESYLRGLLAQGIPAIRVVRLAETMQRAGAAAVRAMNYRADLPERPLFVRRAAAERLKAERRETVAMLAALVRQYAIASADPAVVELAARLVDRMMDLRTPVAASAEASGAVLRRRLELPQELHGPYLELLVRRFDDIWYTTNLQLDRDGTAPAGWLRGRQNRAVLRLATLLGACGDPQLGVSLGGAILGGDVARFRSVVAARRCPSLARTYMRQVNARPTSRLGKEKDRKPSVPSCGGAGTATSATRNRCTEKAG